MGNIDGSIDIYTLELSRVCAMVVSHLQRTGVQDIMMTQKLRLLSISNDAGWQRSLRGAGVKAGFEFIAAPHVSAALPDFEIHAADLLVLDCDRMDAAGSPRWTVPQGAWSTPFMLVSKKLDTESAAASVASGMVAFLPKPVDLRALGPTLQILASHVRIRRDAGLHERTLLAAELHDGIGQELVGAALLADALQRRWERTRDIDEDDFRSLRTLLHSAKNGCRRLAHGRFTRGVRGCDLSIELRALAQNITRYGQIRCSFAGPANRHMRVADFVAHHLLRIAQEALQNASRHSNGSHVEVSLGVESERVHIRIRDDGVGADVGDGGDAGIGFDTMRLRASVIGGTLRLGRGPRGGMEVHVSVPRTPRPASTGARVAVH